MLTNLQDIWDGIRSHVGRFALSIAAIAIGILSLAVLISMMTGLQEKSDRIVRSLGVNVIGILAQGSSNGAQGVALNLRHAQILENNLSDVLVTAMRRYLVSTAGTSRQISLVTTDNNLFKVRQWPLVDGRQIDHYDIVNQERVAVVSEYLSDLWKWRVGKVVLLENLPFRIVGVVKIGGTSLDMESSGAQLMLGDRVVFVPQSINPLWIKSGNQPGSNVDAVFVKVKDSDDIIKTVRSSRRLLSEPKINPGQVAWVTPDLLVSGVQKLRNTIGVTVGSVSVLCLLLGATTLVSLMVANVRDRVREIGLRMALGATRREITVLFVVEAGMVTTFAGFIGAILGYITIRFGDQYIAVPTTVEWTNLLIPVVVALLIGLLSAYWPARIAAKINPSEALRN